VFLFVFIGFYLFFFKVTFSHFTRPPKAYILHRTHVPNNERPLPFPPYVQRRCTYKWNAVPIAFCMAYKLQ